MQSRFTCLILFSLLASALPATAAFAQSSDSSDLDEPRIAYAIGVSFSRNLASHGLPAAAIEEAFLAGVRDQISGNAGLLEDQVALAIQVFQLRSVGERDAANALLEQFGIEDDQTALVNALDLYNPDNLVAYSLGINVGQNLMQQSLSRDDNLESFLAGVRDEITGQSGLSEAQIQLALEDLEIRTEARKQRMLEANLAVSSRYMRENAAKPGVLSLPSGLQYSIMASGPGTGESPTEANSVLVHYHGMLIDGTVIDSSVNQGAPVEFGFSKMVPGWIEALKMMKVGDKWRLFIPPALGFGEEGSAPAIPPNAVVIFNVELLEIR